VLEYQPETTPAESRAIREEVRRRQRMIDYIEEANGRFDSERRRIVFRRKAACVTACIVAGLVGCMATLFWGSFK
jgi:hypothetical protein